MPVELMVAILRAAGLSPEHAVAGMNAGEFSPGDPVFVERMVAAMVLDYVVMVNEDPSLDRDAELIERIRKFLA